MRSQKIEAGVTHTPFAHVHRGRFVISLDAIDEKECW